MLNDFDLETALNNTVANNANQKKDSYGFVVDNRTIRYTIRLE